jgi:hypothetical protein
MKDKTKNLAIALTIYIILISLPICYRIIDNKNTIVYRNSDITGVISGFTDMHDAQYEDFKEYHYIEGYSCKDCGEWIIIDKKTLALSKSDKAFKDCGKRMKL